MQVETARQLAGKMTTKGREEEVLKSENYLRLETGVAVKEAQEKTREVDVARG